MDAEERMAERSFLSVLYYDDQRWRFLPPIVSFFFLSSSSGFETSLMFLLFSSVNIRLSVIISHTRGRGMASLDWEFGGARFVD